MRRAAQTPGDAGIPKGFSLEAQGRAARATLGMAKEHGPTATRLRPFHSSVRVPAGRNLPSRLKAELHTQCVGPARYGVPASAGPASLLVMNLLPTLATKFKLAG